MDSKNNEAMAAHSHVCEGTAAHAAMTTRTSITMNTTTITMNTTAVTSTTTDITDVPAAAMTMSMSHPRRSSSSLPSERSFWWWENSFSAVHLPL